MAKKPSSPPVRGGAPKRADGGAPVAAAWLGVECGGTRTVVLLAPVKEGAYWRAELGAANLRLLDDTALLRHFTAIRNLASATLAGIAIGMAGARTERDRQRILSTAAKVWPSIPCHATDDLETALSAAPTSKGGQPLPRVLVVSGTGSCCLGRGALGKTVRVGGWGHILGDRGSGFDIGLRALRSVLRHFDARGQWPPLGEAILRAVQWNEPDDLINWVKDAEKAEVAALAPEVFNAAGLGDRLAAEVLEEAAAALAEDAAACARRLAKPGAAVEFVLAGSILLKQRKQAQRVTERILRLWPGARVAPLARDSAWGAVELARRHFGKLALASHQPARPGQKSVPGLEQLVASPLPPTEMPNPRSRKLDQLPLAEAVELMIREDARVAGALLPERRKIAMAVEIISRALARGGRLFYAGAGTSGRLGALDAAECPPTFSVAPGTVQGIIAGGRTALWRSVEGAEDDASAGAAAIVHRGVRRRDVVAGIAASGRTPFVWGALAEAKRRGAATILLCFNPRLRVDRRLRPDLIIAPDTGPELLTGSTRLKAGSATKLVLNIFTTLAMTRLGKVMGNLMVDVAPTNEKLRQRAVRITQTLTGATPEAARAALEGARWNIRAGVARLKWGEAGSKSGRRAPPLKYISAANASSPLRRP